MSENLDFEPLVSTIKERCRVCYTCVRECPAKAIRISAGQAEVIGDRCIGCGNCVRVCSQNAKTVRNCSQRVTRLLNSGKKVAACLAPSFPAEFHDIHYKKVVGMVRALGFHYVTEVAFGADLVAAQYRELLHKESDKSHIATTCPAIVSYIEKYLPRLVPALAPVASPMIAQARVLKQYYDDIFVVFIGPCIAKKEEMLRDARRQSVDGVLTFTELQDLLQERHITADTVPASEFDPPHPGKGVLFAVGRGLLEAADLREDLLTNELVATDGTRNFVQAIKEFEEGTLDAVLLEVLCCNGCIMGSGMTTQTAQFTRRTNVSKYARHRLQNLDNDQWRRDKEKFEYIDLSMQFQVDDHRLTTPSKDELKRILEKIGKFKPEDELNCGACGYDTCIDHAIAIHKGLAENEMCLPYTIEKLKKTAVELSNSYELLVNTKNALVQSEKLASMGQLAAGIAHEVNNPLGVVLLYAHLLLEQIPSGSEIHQDMKMIVEQADRAKKIVGGLLNFARKNKVVLKNTQINTLIDKSLHAIIAPGDIRIKVTHRQENLEAEIDQDQVLQVLFNLATNAIEAMPEGGVLEIITSGDDRNVVIEVKDTGTGIEPDKIKRIFEPFFTTKQMGKGTGLGLAVSYGIIKMHHGKIHVESNADPGAGPLGTTFTVTLPRKPSRETAGNEHDVTCGGVNE
jgi:iron only hydrogenase large subunit-like protein/nitrogen-specific signal transduction histidine kinase